MRAFVMMCLRNICDVRRRGIVRYPLIREGVGMRVEYYRKSEEDYVEMIRGRGRVGEESLVKGMYWETAEKMEG